MKLQALRRRWLVVVGVGVLLVGAGVMLVARGATKLGSAAPDPAGQAVPLEFSAAEVVRARRVEMPEQIEFSGALVAPRTVVVRAKASGTLLRLDVAEGARVQAGQSLGLIDVADLRSRVAERDAMVESARARLAEARRNHAANEDLASRQFISPNALESSRAALEAARAQLKSSQAQLDTASVGLREAGLAAPIGGLVGKRHVLPGEKVSVEQELVTLVDLRDLELAGVVGTHQVAKLRPGQPVEVRVEGLSDPLSGRIDRISPAALGGIRGIPVVVVVPNPDERLRAGQYASAVVELPDATLRLGVPLTALSQVSGQDFIWTIEQGVLVRRIVVTGRRQPASGRVEISQGLADGALVLAARFDRLKEGAPARVAAVGEAGARP